MTLFRFSVQVLFEYYDTLNKTSERLSTMAVINITCTPKFIAAVVLAVLLVFAIVLAIVLTNSASEGGLWQHVELLAGRQDCDS